MPLNSICVHTHNRPGSADPSRPLALRAIAIHPHALLRPRCVGPLKGCGAPEHADGLGGRIDRPGRQVLVKAPGVGQHGIEVLHPPYGPPAYGLVEGGGVHKHAAHGRGGAGLRERGHSQDVRSERAGAPGGGGRTFHPPIGSLNFLQGGGDGDGGR